MLFDNVICCAHVVFYHFNFCAHVICCARVISQSLRCCVQTFAKYPENCELHNKDDHSHPRPCLRKSTNNSNLNIHESQNQKLK